MDTLRYRVMDAARKAEAAFIDKADGDGVRVSIRAVELAGIDAAIAIVIEECANVAERFCDEVYGPGVVDAIRDLGASND